MRRLSILFLAMALLSVGVLAQKQLKPWNEWSQKDAQKILNDSPWGQTQTDTDTTEMFYTPTNPTSGSVDAGPDARSNRNLHGATNQAVTVNFHVRFLTAKPIRQALARMIEVGQNNLSKDQLARLEAFTNISSGDSVIVAIAFDASDQRYSGPILQAFGASTTAALKNETYLQRKDGIKVFLGEYVPPGKDGFGARFIFPRQLDGQPFLTKDSGEVRFYSENTVGSKVFKIDRRFKVADMMYNGELEY